MERIPWIPNPNRGVTGIHSTFTATLSEVAGPSSSNSTSTDLGKDDLFYQQKLSFRAIQKNLFSVPFFFKKLKKTFFSPSEWTISKEWVLNVEAANWSTAELLKCDAQLCGVKKSAHQSFCNADIKAKWLEVIQHWCFYTPAPDLTLEVLPSNQSLLLFYPGLVLLHRNSI